MATAQPPLAQATSQQAPQNASPYSGANFDPSASLAMVLQGFQPQAQAAQSGLQNQLAAAGIQGGGAIDAQNVLQRNLAAGLAPTLAQVIQNSQGMELQNKLAILNAFSGLNQTVLGIGGYLAGTAANNFAVEQPNPIWGVLGQAAGAAAGAGMGK